VLAHNENALEEALKKAGGSEAELQTKPRVQSWKIEIALEMRAKGVPVTWLAKKLALGQTPSVRNVLWRARRNKS